jgi:hypothetical protein
MKPLQLLDRWGFCPFCIATQDSRSTVEVHDRYKHVEVAPPGTAVNPVRLTEWLHDHISQDFDHFTLDIFANAFVPVAVIASTPLCPNHLWLETDRRNGRLLRA